MLLCVVAGAAGTSTARADQFSFRTYGQLDGLTNLTVSCLQQSGSGYILTCSEHGLFIYDGRRFSNIGVEQGLPEGGVVYAITFSADGRIILRYETRVFMSRTPLDPQHPPVKLMFDPVPSEIGPVDSDNSAQIVGWRRGAILIADGRLVYVDPGSATRRPVIRLADGLLRQPDGVIEASSPLAVQGQRLWIALSDNRICVLAPGAARCMGRADGLPPVRWLSFFPAGNGHLMARSTSLVADIDPATSHVTTERLPDQPPDEMGFERRPVFIETPAGGILTQSKSGLIVKDGADWKAVTDQNGLPAQSIFAGLFDHENSLWLGGAGTGALRALGYGAWENLSHHDGLSQDGIWQVVRQAGGPLWVATTAGVDAIGAPHSITIGPRHYPDPAYVLAATAHGHLWRSVGSVEVSCITVATGEIRSFPSPPINQILHGKDDRLWLVTEKGLYVIDDTGGEPTAPRPVAGFSTPIIQAAVAEDGSLWMLQSGHRLVHRHTDGSYVAIAQPWAQIDFDPAVMAMAAPGSLWVGGAGGGLYRLDLAGDRIVRTVIFNPPDILSNSVVSILIDARGWVWVGTDRGVSVFDGARWVSADTTSGLISNDLDQGSMFEDSDGSMWFGTSRGLSHLLDPAAIFRTQPLHPVITSVLVGDTQFDDKALPYSKDPLLLQFGILDFKSDGVVRFRYRLQGVDEAWADTASGTVRYPSLPPGHHRFALIAYDPLTGQVSPEVSIMLRMDGPWWLSWPLLALYGIFCGGSVYGLLRLRFRMLVQQRRALQREVELQTREIRQAQAALLLQASQDSLTRLLTRGEIQRRLVEILARPRDCTHMTIGLLDIDHFKRINDRFGHLAGDEILQEMGRRLNDALRIDEHAGRYGGEEILLVLDGNSATGIGRIHDLNDAACGRQFALEGEMLRVTCSIGVTRARADDDWKSLIGRADRALYYAKAHGRDRVVEAPVDLEGY